MTFADNAYCSFMLIKQESFFIVHGRYTLALTQIFPLLAIKLGLSLKTVLLSYSANFYVLYTSIFAIIAHAFKNKNIAIGYLLMILLFMGRIFYLQTEILIGLSFFALLWALTEQFKIGKIQRNWFIVFSLIFIVLTLSSHPLLIIPIVFISLYNMMDKTKIIFDKTYAYILFLAIIILSVKILFVSSDSYEGGYFQTILRKDLWVNFQEQYLTRFFIKNIEHYQIGIVFTGIVLLGLILKGEYLKTLFVSLFILGFYISMSVIFHSGDAPVGMERIFLSLGAILAVPTIKDIWSKYGQIFLVALIVVVFYISLNRIYQFHQEFEQRYAIYKSACDKLQTKQGNKFYFYRPEINERWDLMSTWAISVETLLISTLYNNKSISVYIALDEKDIQSKPMAENTFLFVNFWPFLNTENLADFNTKYLKLPNGNYNYISGKYLMQ